MKAFAKKEPIMEPGPALVAGAVEEPTMGEMGLGTPPTATGPTLSLSGEMGAPIARDYAVGDDFNGQGAFRVVSIDGDNVELELVNLTPSGEPTEDTAEGAIDNYLANKGGGAEEELV